MSSEKVKIFEIGQVHFVSRFLPRRVKKLDELWFSNHGD